MSALPAFKEACLASDSSKKSVSLVGSINGGELEVYSIDLSDLSAATSTFKVKDATSTIAWSPSLPKYCFASPSDMSSTLSVDVTVVQFGETDAFMGSFGSGDRSTAPVPVPALAGGSPKLFALSVAASRKEMFNAYVKGDPGPDKAWRGLLVDLEQPITSKLIRNAGNATTKSPALLAVGILQNSYGTTKGAGYSVIFDKGGNSGTIFSANGDSSVSPTSDNPFLTFGTSLPVLMNNNVLSDKAVPVSMAGTSYILDQDSSTRTVVIYSINTLDTYSSGGTYNFTGNLTRIIPSSGGAPFYSGTLVATYLGKTIVIYTLASDNKPSMSSFDIATSKWSEVKIAAGSSSGGGGGLSTALSVIIYVVSFLLLVCIVKCFWGSIKGLFYWITGKPKNDIVYVVQDAPVQNIALEKINDYSQQQQIVYNINNSINTNNSSNNNSSNNNSVNNNSVNTNNSVNHNNSVNNNSINTNNSVNNNSVNTNNSANNNSVNNNSVNNNSVNNHSVNNSGNVMGIPPAPVAGGAYASSPSYYPAPSAATPSAVFSTPAPQYPSSPYSQPPSSPSPQYHANPYSYPAPSSQFQSAASPPTPMATTPQQFYSAPPQHNATPTFPQNYPTSSPPQVYGAPDGSQQQQQQQQQQSSW